MKKFLLLGALVLCYIPQQDVFANEYDEVCAPKDGYTINFNNVSIIEYIRFVSKISNTNFVFDDQDLNFNVTIISEEPISTKNIMSALMQILRMHNLMLLEQDNNLLITKSRDISQMSTLVTGDNPKENPCKSAIITRVFRIKNANISSIAGIIKPMTSSSALIEVSFETRQLILTDITTNVDKIAELLGTLDAPHSILDIETYPVTTIAPADLVALAMKILTPFIEGQSFTMIPQPDTHNIFIVSTPALIERAMIVLEDLDAPAKERIPSKQIETIFIYPVKHTTLPQILKALDQMREDLALRGNAPPDLLTALKHVTPIESSNSLLFVGDDSTLAKIKNMMETLDVVHPTTAATQNKTVFIYPVKHATLPQILEALNKMRDNLASQNNAPPDLLAALKQVTPIESSNSLLFVGDDATLAKIKPLVEALDVAHPSTVAIQNKTVFIYPVKHATLPQILEALDKMRDKLASQNNAPPDVLTALKQVTPIESSNSLLFVGSDATLAKIKPMVETLDVAHPMTSASTFYLYKLQYVQGNFIETHLKTVAERLKASGYAKPELMATIEKIKWIKDSNSLLITGTPQNIDEIKNMIAEWDIPHAPQAINVAGEKSSFFIYKPVYRSANDLQTAIHNTSIDMQEAGLIDKELFQTLDSVRLVASTNSLLFTGTPESITKLQALLSSLDAPGDAAIQKLGDTTFFIYKLQHVSATQLMGSLKKFASDLEAKNADPDLSAAIESMRWVSETNSILFIGAEPALKKIEQLTQQFDTGHNGPVPVNAPESYVIYTPTYVNGNTLIETLCEFGQHLKDSGIQDKGLFDTINNLRWIEKTCSLLISGDQSSIDKVQELLKRFDIPSGESVAGTTINPIEDTNFLVYKLQYHPGNQLQTALKQVATDLAASGSPLNQELANASNSMQWIQMTNSLLATGKSETLMKLRDLIQNLDVPLRQVFIEVLIIQTTLGNGQQFGLQWGGNIKYLGKFAASTGNITPTNPQTASANTFSDPFLTSLNKVNATTAAVPPIIPGTTSGFDLGVIGDIIMHKGSSFLSLGSLVNALQTDVDSTIVMNPKILTQDNQNATIFVGSNVPYVGSVVNVTGSVGNSTNTNLEYRDVGVSLSITPFLGNGDIVTLNINTNISAIIGSSPTTLPTQSVTGITTTQTNMTTQVHVPNDKFLVLSGMVQDTKDHFKSGLPCLGGLPVIGFAFSENDRSDSKSNVIIFVRPHIIDTFDDYRKVTENQENLFREQAGLPILKEYFDAGLDLVKTPEDE